MDIIINYLEGNTINQHYFKTLEKIDKNLLNHLKDRINYKNQRHIDVLIAACKEYANLTRNIPGNLEFVKVQYPDKKRVQYISYGNYNNFYDYYFVFHLHDPRIETPVMNYSFKSTPPVISYYKNASIIRETAKNIRDEYHRNVFCDYYIKNNMPCPDFRSERLIEKFKTEELFFKYFNLYNSEFLTLSALQKYDEKMTKAKEVEAKKRNLITFS